MKLISRLLLSNAISHTPQKGFHINGFGLFLITALLIAFTLRSPAIALGSTAIATARALWTRRMPQDDLDERTDHHKAKTKMAIARLPGIETRQR